MSDSSMTELPSYLKRYIVIQNQDRYTPLDQAVWRYILRQLKSYLGQHAHESYLDGLSQTGISTEKIPLIKDISERLSKFGWRALPVSGFIPPAAFMELQSLGILPIASDMRTLDHLLYTPAPDIVHEAAGHAPLLVNKNYSNYLKEYAQIAKKALISKEDMNVYRAIRDLSDIKENPNSTDQDIATAEKNLTAANSAITHVSEAALLSRMNWWTAEYGLIGDLNSPKIIGAGLLSSVGESELFLSDSVKKIPLSIDCLNYYYDI
ncbi:MAG: aromatic amino acid hydroxylase, partial [Pseudobdellovibrionaceae bacterium]